MSRGRRVISRRRLLLLVSINQHNVLVLSPPAELGRRCSPVFCKYVNIFPSILSNVNLTSINILFSYLSLRLSSVFFFFYLEVTIAFKMVRIRFQAYQMSIATLEYNHMSITGENNTSSQQTSSSNPSNKEL